MSRMFLTELDPLHIDQLAAARLDTETSMLELDKAHTAELEEMTRRHSDTMTQLTANLAAVTADLAAVTAGREEDSAEFTAQREQVGTQYVNNNNNTYIHTYIHTYTVFEPGIEKGETHVSPS